MAVLGLPRIEGTQNDIQVGSNQDSMFVNGSLHPSHDPNSSFIDSFVRMTQTPWGQALMTVGSLALFGMAARWSKSSRLADDILVFLEKRGMTNHGITGKAARDLGALVDLAHKAHLKDYLKFLETQGQRVVTREIPVSRLFYAEASYSPRVQAMLRGLREMPHPGIAERAVIVEHTIPAGVAFDPNANPGFYIGGLMGRANGYSISLRTDLFGSQAAGTSAFWAAPGFREVAPTVGERLISFVHAPIRVIERMLGALRNPALKGPLWEYQGLAKVNLGARNLMMREQGVHGLVTPFSRLHPNHGFRGTQPDWPWQVRVPLLDEGKFITYKTVGGKVHQIHPYSLMVHDLMMGAIKPSQEAIATAGEEALQRMGRLYL